MKRRSFIRTTSLLIGALPAIRILGHQSGIFNFEMEILRSNVGYFKERGGTIGWLTGDDGIVVVDTQFPEQAGHFIDELRKESQAPIEYLINTHHHGDHTSGNIVFKDLARNILAHENSVKNQKASAEANGTQATQLYPNMTYTNQWSARIGNELITLDYWGPAHTDGDSIIHFTNANVVHMGDLVFNRRHPYIDKGAGALISNWITVLNKTCTHFDDEAIFIFGHAEDGYQITGGKDDIRAFTNYLEKVLEHVGVLLHSGKTDEEILKETMIRGAEEWKGQGIERSLKAAIVELREGK